jgi:signal transduction histidine kinase
MQAEVLRMDRLASLGVLASGIAHEIKNPLAGIKTMAQTLEEDFSGSDQRKVYMERIIRQVNRLDELLKTFFDYARPRPPQRKFHSVQDIIHEVLTLVDQKLAERNIEWSQEYHDDTPVIFVDFHQIQQVFLNLILNAIDAMPDGGTLRISASPSFNSILDASLAETMLTQGSRLEKFVRISVADSGIGIEERNLDRIFDPFFTTKSQGTGLGLSIIHRIVTAHHGKINVESTLDKGTVFSVILPAEEAAS